MVELQLDVVSDGSHESLFVPQFREVHRQRVIQSVHESGSVVSQYDRAFLFELRNYIQNKSDAKTKSIVATVLLCIFAVPSLYAILKPLPLGIRFVAYSILTLSPSDKNAPSLIEF